MKKTLSLILALCMCLTLGASITGCSSGSEDSNHTHSFETSWSYNEEYHWHVCEVDNCTEISDKKIHDWIRHTEFDIEATKDEDGVLAYICEVCGKIKKESVTFNGISDDEWNAIIDASNFENYTLQDQTKAVITMLSDGSKMEMTTNSILKFADGKVHSSHTCVTDGQESSGSRLYESQDAIFVKNSFTEMFGALKRENFQYDPEANQYIAKQSIEIPVWYTYYETDGQETTVPDTQQWENVIIELSNGKLACIYYNTIVVSEELGTSTEYEVVYTFSDYGTTTISENGSSLQAAMSEAEWNSMLDASNFANYTLNYEKSCVNKYSDGREEEHIHSTVAVRITSDKMAERYLDLLLSDSTWSSWFVYETGESEKFSHEWIFLTLLDGKYNEWQYDAEKNIYCAPNGITTTCFMEIPILVEMSSGEVKVSDYGKLSEATFDVIFTDETYGMVQEGVFTFRFSEYGTTVISEDITPDPPIPDPEPEPNPVNELEYTLSEDGTYYSVTGIGSYTNMDIVIPSTHKGLPVKEIGAYALANRNMTNITIPSTVETIEEGAFAWCSKLIYVTIPDSVVEIGRGAFSECYGLKSLTIGRNVTKIGSDAFYEARGIVEVINFSNMALDDLQREEIGLLYNVKEIHSGESKIINQNDYLFYSYDGTDYLIGYIGEDTELILPNDFKGNNYSICPCAFWFRDDIVKVTIGDNVDTIDGQAFWSCENLTDIIISDNVSRIWGWNAFSGTAYEANEANWSDGVLYIGNWLITANRNISGEYEIKVGTKKIADTAFYACDDLTSITIPEGVISIGVDAFSYCEGLAGELVIPNSVIDIGEGAFLLCEGLTDVVIGNSVEAIGVDAFRLCRALKSVIIPNSVTYIGDCAFDGCNNLITAIIGNGVTHIGRHAFSDCSRLASVTIGENVMMIGENAFYGNNKLVEVINLSDLPIVAESEEYGNIALKAIEVHNGTSKLGNLDDYIFYTYDGTNYLLEYVGDNTALIFPNTYNGENYEIYKFAFYQFDHLESVILSDAITNIGEWAFSCCYNLRDVTLGNGIEKIDAQAFSLCYLLPNIKIPNSVTTIGRDAFQQCYNLISVTIGSGVTAIEDYAFSSCPKLVEVINHSTLDIKGADRPYFYGDLPQAKIIHNEETKIVNQDDYLFFVYDDINYLIGYIGDDTELRLPFSYNEEPYEIYPYAFYGLEISRFCIPNIVMRIGEKAFMGTEYYSTDSNWENGVLYIGDCLIEVDDNLCGTCNIKNGTRLIANYAFDNCIYITELKIPDSLTHIGDCALFACTGLDSVYIPDNVIHIGYRAFFECSNLENVYYTGAQEDWKNITIGDGNQPLLTANIQYGVEE